jgi:hypothetical protein
MCGNISSNGMGWEVMMTRDNKDEEKSWETCYTEITATTEAVSTIGTTSLTVGLILIAFEVLQASAVLPILVLALLVLAGLVSILKFGRALVAQKLKVPYQDHEHVFLNTLRNKDLSLGIFFSAAAAGASVVTIYPAASAVVLGLGILHPALAIACLGFVLDAIDDVYTDYCHWKVLEKQERESSTTIALANEDKLVWTPTGKKAPPEKDMGDAKKLLLSSFIKLAGWVTLLTSSFAFVVSCAPYLAAGGLITIASSCLYKTLRLTLFAPTLGLSKEPDKRYLFEKHFSVASQKRQQ